MNNTKLKNKLKKTMHYAPEFVVASTAVVGVVSLVYAYQSYLHSLEATANEARALLLAIEAATADN